MNNKDQNKNMMVWSVKKSAPLQGEVNISSSKNAALPILAATLMLEDETELLDLSRLSDIQVMIDIIAKLGGKVQRKGYKTRIVANQLKSTEPNHELVRGMRASFLCMGALLARYGEATMPLPGGCKIGARPVDLHLRGFQNLGAHIELKDGMAIARGKLKGGDVPLQFPSVGATENLIMAASLAGGDSVIRNAAREPEIIDLCDFLRMAGANIEGDGTKTIRIRGVERLRGVSYRPIPDRVEAGTFMYAAAVTRGDVHIRNVKPPQVQAVTEKLMEAGISVEETTYGIRVKAVQEPKAVDIKTAPYPGFPTDLQAPAMVLSAVSKGQSVISETLFENRFNHARELERMGADITIKGQTAKVSGSKKLKGTKVWATDLRAGAALILAGLCAEGESEVIDPGHVKRGYESFAVKLNSLGADLRLLPNVEN